MSLDRLHLLLEGAVVTIEVFVLSALLATPLALLAGLARASGVRALRRLAGLYIEVGRGTSALVQVFFVFYVLPLLGVELPPLAAGVIALGVNYGAYGGEVVRSAVLAVSRSQREVALALGMGPVLTLRRVILPQAFPRMLPPAGNQLVELLKATSLVSVITLAELTFTGREIIQDTGDVNGTWLAVLLFYFVLALPLRAFVGWLERRASVSPTIKVG